MKAVDFCFAGVLLAMVAGMAAANPAHRGSPADGYLKPELKVGEQLMAVYSKSVSWFGPGLKGHGRRFSGVSTMTIASVTPDAVAFTQRDVTDGQPPGPTHHGKILAGRSTVCTQGKCRLDDETSGWFFMPYLWGQPPPFLQAGSHWSVRIDKPWEIGPEGTEQVRVVSTDPANGEITLVRHGTGEGPSSDDLYRASSKKPLEITTSDDKKVAVTLHPGKAAWTGYTTVRRGVIVGDTILLTQQVRFVAANGKTWNAEFRVYTLENLGNDPT